MAPHSTIADGRWHGFGGARGSGPAANTRPAAGGSLNHAGVGFGTGAWRGGYFAGRGGYWGGRGGYWGYPGSGWGWGGWGWGLGWGWGFGWGWDPFWYWPPYWYEPWWGYGYPDPYIYANP